MDFDALVNTVVVSTFGQVASGGQLLSYTSPDGSQTCTFDGVFDEAWRELDFHTSRHAPSMPVSTTKPAVGCQLSAFPPGLKPIQNGSVTRITPLLAEDGTFLLNEDGTQMLEETQYVVSDVRPDGISGWVLLVLN